MSQYIYNEHDVNQVKALRISKKKKKFKRRLCILLFILAVGGVVWYLMNDISKVQSIKIEGNNRISKETLLESLPIKEHESYWFMSYFEDVQSSIEQMQGVKSVSIERSLFGNLTITIQEAKIIAYQEKEDTLVCVDENGDLSQVKNTTENKKELICAVFSQFPNDVLKMFSKEYVKLPQQIKQLVSDVVYDPLDHDATRCKIYMGDGKILIIRYDQMTKQLEGDNYARLIQSAPDKTYYDLLGKYSYSYD